MTIIPIKMTTYKSELVIGENHLHPLYSSPFTQGGF